MVGFLVCWRITVVQVGHLTAVVNVVEKVGVPKNFFKSVSTIMKSLGEIINAHFRPF